MIGAHRAMPCRLTRRSTRTRRRRGLYPCAIATVVALFSVAQARRLPETLGVMFCVSDNEIYLYVVSVARKRIVLHTTCPLIEEPYVDIVFSDVAAVQFDDVRIP